MEKFNAKYKDLNGKMVKKTVASNIKNLRLKNGAVVDANLFIKIANGKKLSEDELKGRPALANITKDEAADYLNHLVQIKYAHLVDPNDIPDEKDSLTEKEAAIAKKEAELAALEAALTDREKALSGEK